MSIAVVTVVDSGYSKGLSAAVSSGGTIYPTRLLSIDGSTPFSGDPLVLGFKYKNTEYAMLVSYNYTVPPITKGTATVGFYQLTVTDSPVSNTWTLVGKQTYDGLSILKFTNPYALVIENGSDYLFVGDYDSGNIVSINLANLTTGLSASDSAVAYNAPTSVSPYETKCNGLDYVNGYITAIYSRINPNDYTDYDASSAVILSVSGASLTRVDSSDKLNQNVVAVAADISGTDIYAYVCSIGGPQQAGGNVGPTYISQLQVLRLRRNTLTLIAIINASSNPPALADFQDVIVYNADVYGIVANYDNAYTTYTYRLFKVSSSNLQQGIFTSSTVAITGLLSAPAGPAWLLAPSGDSPGDPLWFASGDVVNTLSTTLGVTSRGTPATLGVSSPTAINAHINRAAVVIHGAAAPRGEEGRSASVTKVSRRLSPEELKKGQK